MKEKTLAFNFGVVHYYNTDDIEAISSAVLKAAKAEASRYPSSGSMSSIQQELHLDPASASVGLFYLSRDFQQVYTLPFPLGTPTSSFGWHKDFFKKLVKQKDMQGIDYESCPRGFTIFENKIYLAVAGDWLTKEIAERICMAFNYDPNLPRAHFDSPLYTYRNNGASERLNFQRYKN